MNIDLQNLNEQLKELQPPQLRDRLIFEAVEMNGRGQREVAAEHGVSQPRVAQIVVEVGEWLARVLPQGMKEIATPGRLALGTFLAEARLTHLQQVVMAAWEGSCADRVTRKEGLLKNGRGNWWETITVPQSGKVGFLSAALRLALAQARLAGVDTSGRTQRQAAEKSLIAQTEKSAASEKTDSPEDERLSLDTRRSWTLEQEHDELVNRLIKDFRADPEFPPVTDVEMRVLCEKIWEEEFQAGAEEFHRTKYTQAEPASGPHKLGGEAASELTLVSGDREAGMPRSSTRDASPSPLPRGKGRRLRREWEKRRSRAERRREFLAPLAAG